MCSFPTARRLGWVGVIVSLPGVIRAQPSDCAPSEVAAFHLSAPEVSERRLEVVDPVYGEAPELALTARLRTRFETERGVTGWAISVLHDPDVLEILDATDEGTDGYELSRDGGFRVTDVATDDSDEIAGFVHAAISGTFGDAAFPPVGDYSLARATYRIGPADPPEESGLASWEEESSVDFVDGLRGRGQPVSNVVTHEGHSVFPCKESLALRIRHLWTEEFIRGDANRDQVLDVSDAVTTLRHHFVGDVTVRCVDAADTNDDSTFDISDAIYIFNYLFLGGPAPPSPFPELGPDPTDDDLFCQP
jgi:hypothetical protein